MSMTILYSTVNDIIKTFYRLRQWFTESEVDVLKRARVSFRAVAF